jgi:hypothetical protein
MPTIGPYHPPRWPWSKQQPQTFAPGTRRRGSGPTRCSTHTTEASVRIFHVGRRGGGSGQPSPGRRRVLRRFGRDTKSSRSPRRAPTGRRPPLPSGCSGVTQSSRANSTARRLDLSRGVVHRLPVARSGGTGMGDPPPDQHWYFRATGLSAIASCAGPRTRVRKQPISARMSKIVACMYRCPVCESRLTGPMSLSPPSGSAQGWWSPTRVLSIHRCGDPTVTRPRC